MFQGTGFGAGTTSTPFGQSAFGKPATSGFSAPVFGSNPGTSLFGSTNTQQSGGLFGSSTTPSFGQPQTTQSAFGGGFTSTSSGSGLFGTQQNTNAGGGLFGASGSSAFGQAKPAFSGGFGTTQQPTGGLFGQQPQQPQQTTPLFGQPSGQTAPTLFGSSGFGATNAPKGTTIKFVPVTGTDTAIKNGGSVTTNTKHHCITCMKEYESDSLEELRLQDYMANRKGPQQGSTGSTSLFGSGTQPSLFGSGTTTGTTSTGLFGSSFGTGGGTGVFGSTGTGNNLFGKPAGAATPFGTPAATTATTGFGFSNTNANPFGTNTAQKPFGATGTQSTGLFGSTSQPTSGFGTQSAGFGSFGTQQGGGIFSQNKTTFNLGTTTSGFGFNQQAPTSNTGTGLFGAKPAATGFSPFGAPASTATSTFATGFGATNQNNLFGSNTFKPSTPGFSFGGTSTTTNTAPNSLFGTTANKPGGLFGQTPNLFGGGTTFGTGSTFNTGSNTLGIGGNFLQNNKANPLQSSTNANQSNPMNQHLLTLAAIPFGDSPLFKTLLPPSGKADELIKPTSPSAQKALITGQNYKVSPKANTKIKMKPIEPNNMTKKSLFEGLDGDEELTNEVLGNTVRPSPKQLIFRNRSGLSDFSCRTSILDAANNNSPEVSTIPKNCPGFIMSSNSPKRNIMLDIQTPKAPAASSTIIKNAECKDQTPKTPLSSTTIHENTISELRSNSLSAGSPQTHPSLQNQSKETVEPSTSSSSADSDLEETVQPEMEPEGEDHPTGIVLRRVGYYTIPTLKELADLMDSEGRCVVDNFTVGRLNYGNIFFPESFDVTGLNLDEIVHFRHKEVVVYPNDDEKPPIGCGLNRRAQVTLDRVWPIDKTTRLPISDPARISALDYESKLRRASAKHGTRFVEYRPQTGSWVFKVDHFSKYGLSDSDDEDDLQTVDPKKMKMTIGSHLNQEPPKPPQVLPVPKAVEKIVDNGLAPSLLYDEDENMDDGINSPFDLDEEFERRNFSPTGKLGKHLSTSSHKLQLMKASFFNEDYNIDGEFLDYDDLRGAQGYSLSSVPLEAVDIGPKYSWYSQKVIEQEDLMRYERQLETSQTRDDEMEVEPQIVEKQLHMVQPTTYVLKFRDEVLSLAESTVGQMKSSCLLDMCVSKGRSFRVGFGLMSHLVHMTTFNVSCAYDAANPLSQLVGMLKGRTNGDVSLPVLAKLQLRGGFTVDDTSFSFAETVQQHLDISLKTSSITLDPAGCPELKPKLGTSELHQHCSVSQRLLKLSSDPLLATSAQAWGLCLALWGSLPDCEVPGSHACVMARRQAVSDWLQLTISSTITEEVNKSSDASAVFSLLTGYNMAEACETAQKMGDHQLALLMSQLGCGSSVRVLVRKQLVQWCDTQADRHIDRERLKTMMLVAGIPIHQTSSGVVNVCDEMDWIRAFAIHLWYVCSLSASVTDALVMYEKAIENGQLGEGYAAPPLPSYCKDFMVETSSGKPVCDIIFHLLKLFSHKSHPLESIVNPASHTPDPLDYRLCWFLLRVLTSLGYSHISEHSLCLVHESFASQLEAYGLWQWSAFVLLHLPNSARREKAVRNLIERFISPDDIQNDEKEEFLIKKLRIPLQWIYEAKAIKAAYLAKYKDAAKYLIKAGDWNESHCIIMEHIAAKSIINEKYNYLEGLLSELDEDDRKRTIFGWNSGGGVILEYLRVFKEVSKIVEARDPSIGYHLERLQPQLANLCMKIKLLKTPSLIDRLSQAEMSKRTAGLFQNLIITHCGDETATGINLLSQMVGELPLPGDYAQQEWLSVISSWTANIADMDAS